MQSAVDSVPIEVLLPTQEVPPSVRHRQRCKVGAISQLSTFSTQPSCVLDERALPVLIPSSRAARVPHSYVTQSLFHEKSSLTTSNLSACPSAVGNDAICGVAGRMQVIGVEKDVFTDMELLGSDSCHSDYICCQLVEELSVDAYNISKIRKQTGLLLTIMMQVHDTFGSDSGSDWEEYATEICQEDLPRLGVVMLEQDFHSRPFEWQMADEFWASHRTEYSHDTTFQGAHPEPLPEWLKESLASVPVTNLN
ncbi:hypothetical protein R1sor_010326 [Riccia sorocarpa]|uniref:Uncharacterized protein n=1 Tax=Riccia sorocarpa TaxID=122646 RepID=A0ABD3I194_9MARC